MKEFLDEDTAKALEQQKDEDLFNEALLKNAAGAGLSRKERRASKKAAKKAQKAGSGYYSGAFDSPLSNADNDPASGYDTDDSRNASDDEYIDTGIFAQDGFEDGGEIWMEWG